ncbi:type 1 glutamine amidotransferase [Halorhabdus sp. CUG00001]|uniref:type 1 glutamine amidotransferase n=1 Tax=Halorhabdus sp. CUG00001 TaxID=2600297 RepID=UPI00131C8CEE|nr:type 1 glutamine amidotransferase [Halorhabdus sp. CUG00001]
MARPRLALLNAAHDGTDTRRNFRRELDADLVEFDATGRELPETFAFDGFVVTGSRASVYWAEPWIADLKAWVEEAIETGLGGLGVCFGHQLVAAVLGGDVEAMDDYEIGYREIERTGPSRLLSGIDRTFTAFTTHADRVATLPPGATRLAENEYGIHAFRAGTVFGVQFHPEYDQATARAVTRSKDELTDERKAAVLDGITRPSYLAACTAKQVFENVTQELGDNEHGAGSGTVAGD